jgi:hypothetical protein
MRRTSSPAPPRRDPSPAASAGPWTSTASTATATTSTAVPSTPTASTAAPRRRR